MHSRGTPLLPTGYTKATCGGSTAKDVAKYRLRVVLPNSIALFQQFQLQNRNYLDTLEGTKEKLFGFELGAPPHCEIR